MRITNLREYSTGLVSGQTAQQLNTCAYSCSLRALAYNPCLCPAFEFIPR